MVDEEDDDNMYQDAEDEGIYDIGGGGDAAGTLVLYLWLNSC